MIVKDIIYEDFVNYKKPSMFIIFPKCNFKCDREARTVVCQNGKLVSEPNFRISMFTIREKYLNNSITSAIVMGGLEPFDSPNELSILIGVLRDKTKDDIVIYTGYTKEEIKETKAYKEILQYPNIIIKFGRFIPNQKSHYDEVLGIELASDNQYAEKIT